MTLVNLKNQQNQTKQVPNAPSTLRSGKPGENPARARRLTWCRRKSRSSVCTALIFNTFSHAFLVEMSGA